MINNNILSKEIFSSSILSKSIFDEGAYLFPPFWTDVVQWLRGDTFEEEGTTYMRDYSGNDYHAIVISSDVIQQQITSTDLYTADLQQSGFWFTDASTANQINKINMNYEVYDSTPFYGLTFSDITDGEFKNIISYATVKDSYQKASILNFVNGNHILLDSDGQIITTSTGDDVYVRIGDNQMLVDATGLIDDKVLEEI